jgi:tripartite-type tricarboxylate transporter receptor subunit TctC
MRKICGLMSVVTIAIAAGTGPASAADPVEAFYSNNRIDFVIGVPAGAAYDVWARLLGRHMGKYIPGNPTFLPRNMPGASTMVAVNYMYNQAPRDGSVIAMIGRSMPLQEALGNSAVQFKSAEFGYIGSTETIYHVCAGSPAAKVKTTDDLFKQEFIVGGTGGGATASATPALLTKILGMKIKVIDGYASPPEVFLAMERGEVDGMCTSLSGIQAARPGWIAEGKMKVLLSIEEKKITGVPGVDAPTVYSFIKSDEHRQIIDFFNVSSELGWPVGTTPGVPKERLEALRHAFEATMKDKDFLSEASTLGLNIAPATGDELQRIVTKMMQTPKAVIDKTTEIVGKLE